MSTTSVRSATLTNESSHLWMRYLWARTGRDSGLNWGDTARTVVNVASDVYEKHNGSLGDHVMFPWACERFHERVTTADLNLWAHRHDKKYWLETIDHRYNTALMIASGVLPFSAENKPILTISRELLIQNWIEGVWQGVHGFNPRVDGNFFRNLSSCALDALDAIVKPLGVKAVLSQIKFADASHKEIQGSSSIFDMFAERIRRLSVERKVWGDDTPNYAKTLYELRVGEYGQHRRENIMLVALATLNAQAEYEQMPKEETAESDFSLELKDSNE